MSAFKLHHKHVVTVSPTAPFLFDATVYKPAHFPSNDMRWEPGKRWQTMVWQEQPCGLLLENTGTIEQPQMLLHIYTSTKPAEAFITSLTEEVQWRFNLNLNVQSFYEAVKNDPVLKPVIKKYYGMRPMHHGSLYEYLVVSILLQNTTVKRSVTMMQTLFEHYGTLLEYNNQQLWCFWNPATLSQVSEEELRSLKVGYRAKSFLRISQTFVKNEINEFQLRKKNNDELEKELLTLYGVGPSSVWILMFEVFNRMDHLNHISPWEQKIYTKLFFNKDYEQALVPVSEMIAFFDERWGTWKNLAINYVWEDVWWKQQHERIPWLEKLIRL